MTEFVNFNLSILDTELYFDDSVSPDLDFGLLNLVGDLALSKI